MATGASTADLAVILIDARKGVLPQTKRHTYIANMLGVRHIVAGGQQDGPRRLQPRALPRDRRRAICRLPKTSASRRITPIPMSALNGDNVTTPLRSHALARGPDAARAPRDDRDRRRARRRAVPPAGAVGQPPQPRFPRLFRHDHLRLGEAGRRGRRRHVGQDVEGEGASSPPMAIFRRPRPATPSRWSSRTRSTLRAATFSRRRMRGRKSRTSSPPTCSGCTRTRSTTGHAYVLKIGAQTVQATVTGIRHKIDINTLDKTAGHALAPQRDRLLQHLHQPADRLRPLQAYPRGGRASS